MNKIRRTTVFLFLVIATSFAGCSSDGSFSTETEKRATDSDIAGVAPEQEPVEESNLDSRDAGSDEKSEKTVSPGNENQVSIDKAGESKKDAATPVERKIIRNATLQLESGSPEDAQKKVTAIAEDKKGFVVQSRKSASDLKNRGRKTVMMTIRVPAESFNEALEEIRKTGDRLVDESVTGKDVTEEFIDIEARLRTKKALEERFLEIMKQSRSVKDALNVQRELANVRTEIERIEGRKRFLENQSSLSTIKISIATPTAISGSSSGFFYDLREAVSDGFDAALGFILILIRVLIALVPFLFLIVLPVFLVLRYFWRNYKKRRLAKAIVENEIKDVNMDEK